MNAKNEPDKGNSNLPKSTQSDNTFKDFIKICHAYYNELMHISKSTSPSLSKDDLIVLDDLLKEISSYSLELIKRNFIEESRKVIDIGLVIVDFLLKIFGSMSSNKDEINLSEKLEYPLSIKLILLEANFNILFKYDKNYSDSIKNLEEVIEIQKCLGASNYNLASSKFYMAILKFYLNDVEKAEELANEALDMIEMKSVKEQSKKDYSNTNEIEINENRKTRKMSNILEFLAELYELRKDYDKVVATYERVYYLNLGRFGGQSVNTEYFKTKLDIFKEEMKRAKLKNQEGGDIYNKTNHSRFNISQGNSRNDMMNNTNNFGYSSPSYSQNIIHKGKADSFAFKIPTSNYYEPLLVSIYKLGEDDNKRYSSEMFVCNLCFDKIKLLRFLNVSEGNNGVFYTDESLNKILCNISLMNGYVTFLDFGLKNALINSVSTQNSSTNKRKSYK